MHEGEERERRMSGDDAGWEAGSSDRDAPREEAVRAARRKMCALFDACREEGSPEGIRDAALLSVLYGAGVSRGAALGLAREAYDAGRAVLRWTPPDEDGEPRFRRAAEGAREALEAWLEVRGDASGPLLCRLEGRREDPRGLTDEDVTEALRRAADRAGVEFLDEAELIRLYTSPWWEEVRGEARA